MTLALLISSSTPSIECSNVKVTVDGKEVLVSLLAEATIGFALHSPEDFSGYTSPSIMSSNKKEGSTDTVIGGSEVAGESSSGGSNVGSPYSDSIEDVEISNKKLAAMVQRCMTAAVVTLPDIDDISLDWESVGGCGWNRGLKLTYGGMSTRLYLGYTWLRDYMLLTSVNSHCPGLEAWLRAILLDKVSGKGGKEAGSWEMRCDLMGRSMGQTQNLSKPIREVGAVLKRLPDGGPDRVESTHEPNEMPIENTIPHCSISSSDISMDSTPVTISHSTRPRGRPKGSKPKGSKPKARTPTSSSFPFKSALPPSTLHAQPHPPGELEQRLVVLPPEFQEPQGVMTRARRAILMGKRLGMEFDCSEEYALREIASQIAARR